MEWFRKHIDTLSIIGSICASLIWMNGKFNTLEKDVAIIKTVLIMKQIMPTEICHKLPHID